MSRRGRTRSGGRGRAGGPTRRPTARRSWRWVRWSGGVVVLIAGVFAYWVGRTGQDQTDNDGRPAREASANSAVVPNALAESAAGTPTPQHRLLIPEPDLSGMQGPVAQRLAAARDAVVRSPDSSAAWGEYGAVCHAHGLHREAMACYRRARALAPRDFNYPYLLAVVLSVEGGDRDEVVALYREAIGRQPDYAAAHVRLGWVLDEQGRTAAARDAYARAVELHPDLAVARYALGEAMLALGKASAAIEQLERAAELAPKDSLTRAALARAYRRAGDIERARDLAESARSLKPALPLPDPLTQSVMNLGQGSLAVRRRFEYFLRVGQYARAIPELLTFARTHSDHPYYQMLLSLAYLRSGRPEEADLYFLRALELKEAITASGEVGARRRDQATRADTVIVVFCPEYLERLITDGDIERLGRVTERLKRFASMLPNSAPLELAWGKALHRLGDDDEAETHYRRANKLDPKSPAAGRLEALRAGTSGGS